MFSPDTRALIGGRWAVSLPMFLVSAPALLLSQLMFVSPDERSGSLAIVLVAGLVSIAAVGVILFLAHVTVLAGRREHPVSIAVVASVGVAAGAGRAIVALACTWTLTGTPTHADEAWGRIVGGAVAGGILLPLGAWAFAVGDRLRSQRTDLRRELTAALRRTAVAQEQAQALRLQSMAIAASQVQVVTDDLIALSENPDLDDDALRAAIEAANDERVRSLGHELWREPVDTESMSWRATLRSTDAGLVPIPAMVAILLAVAAPREFALRSPAEAVTTLLIITAIAAAALALVRLTPVRARRWWHVPAALCLASVAIAVIGAVWIGRSTAVAEAAAIGVAMITIALCFAVARAAVLRAEERLDRLRATISEAEIEAAAAQEMLVEAHRETATRLHSHVYNALVVAARELETGDPAQRRSWVDAYLAELPSQMLDYEPGTHRLAEVAQVWSGLVALKVDALVDLPATVENDVSVIAQEALANAFRHGHARRIRIHVACGLDEEQHSQWLVTVDADGVAPPTDLRMGIGLRRIARHSCEWSLEPGVEGGSRLRARVARLGE